MANDPWKEKLTSEQYQVTRCCGTERPFSGKYNKHYEAGIYLCQCCKSPLFSSQHKFDSGSGWPSFWEKLEADNIKEIRDTSHGMLRVEVRCQQCDAHLGHVFTDGPDPTGLRYCINSLSLDFKNDD
ncbi:MAG: peptide-methionine (R)-S-oxide reductase MsrB [Gammaproteobacteria bacterium]|nr:peptide-methionine (R)-S-oxide reductase MsrB [Gammaproteobacteria bacterium]